MVSPTIPTTMEQLALRASAMKFDAIPTEILWQARLCVLDTLGCILAGTRTEEAALLRTAIPSAEDGKVTGYGSQDRHSITDAALLHGYLGDVLELNDLIGGHAGIGNVTAILAVAEAQGSTNGRLLEAVVRGMETTAAVYQSVYPTLRRFTDCGMVPVGVPSSIGVATAVAHLHQLDDAATPQAMAMAGALSGWCPAEVIFGHGGTLKPMLFGAQPALAGIQAVGYAKCGLTGPLRLLESPLGFFSTASTAGLLTQDLLARWALATPRRKLHACCGYIHSAADAARRARALMVPGGSIEIRIPPYTADVVAKARAPESSNDARFHLQYCLALMLSGADAIAPEHSIDFAQYFARPAIQALLVSISVIPDENLKHYEKAVLRIFDANGSTVHTIRQDCPRGAPGQPLTDSEVISKFSRLAEPVLGSHKAKAIIAEVTEGASDANAAGWLRSLAVSER